MVGIRRWQIPNCYHYCQSLTMVGFWLVGICWGTVVMLVMVVVGVVVDRTGQDTTDTPDCPANLWLAAFAILAIFQIWLAKFRFSGLVWYFAFAYFAYFATLAYFAYLAYLAQLDILHILHILSILHFWHFCIFWLFWHSADFAYFTYFVCSAYSSNLAYFAHFGDVLLRKNCFLLNIVQITKLEWSVSPSFCQDVHKFFFTLMSQKSSLFFKWLLQKVKIKWETPFLIGAVLIVTRIWEFDCSTDNVATRWNC